MFGKKKNRIPTIKIGRPDSLPIIQNKLQPNRDDPLRIGLAYMIGDSPFPRDHKRAMYWLSKAITHNEDESYLLFAMLKYYFNGYDKEGDIWLNKALNTINYSNGYTYEEAVNAFKSCYGMPLDKAETIFQLIQAVKQNNSIAEKKLADSFSTKGSTIYNFNLAMYYYQRAAEHGNVQCQFILGQLFEKGEEVEKDISIAAYWYKRAAEAGFTEAQYSLGRLCDLNGKNNADYAMAAYYYSCAVLNGRHAGAIYYSAHLLVEGRGIDRDFKAGMKMAEEACKLNYPGAKEYYQQLYEIYRKVYIK